VKSRGRFGDKTESFGVKWINGELSTLDGLNGVPLSEVLLDVMLRLGEATQNEVNERGVPEVYIDLLVLESN